MLVDSEEVIAPPAMGSRGIRFARAMGLGDVGRALRDFTAYLPAQFVPALAGFLALPILARQLAPTELGVLTIAQTLISLGWILSSQWLTSASMREYALHRDGGRLAEFSQTLGGGFVVVFGLLIGFGVLLVLAAEASSGVGGNVLFIFGATAGLVIQNFATTLFAAELRPRFSALVDVVARTGGIAFGTYLVWHGHKVGGYLFGMMVVSFAAGLPSLLAALPRLRSIARPRFDELGAWARFGIPVAVGSGLFWALLLVDRYLLAVMRNTKDVGIYSVGAVVGDKAISIPMLAFYAAARPLLISTYDRDGRGEAERLVWSYTRLTLVLGIPAVAMAVVAARPVVSILVHGYYSQLYAPAAKVVPLIALGGVIDASSRIGTAGLGLARRNKSVMYTTLFGLGVNVGLNLVLIPLYGIEGAAIATPITSLALLAAQLHYSRRHLTWHFPYATLARALAAALLGGVVARYAMSTTSSDLIKILLAAGVGGVVYACTLALLGERRQMMLRRV